MLMEVNEFKMFILAPFATRIYVEAGKINTLDDEFLANITKEKQYQIEWNPNLRKYSKQSVAKMTSNPDSSTFPYMERIIGSVKFILKDYEVSSNNITYKFENNSVYFYEAGTGLFSTEVRVTILGRGNLDLIDEAERFAREVVRNKYKNHLLNLRNIFSETIAKKDIKELTRIASDPYEIGGFEWLHIVYYFYNTEFLITDEKFRNKLKEDIHRDLSSLLNQAPHEMSSSLNSYVFFGDGKSLIVTGDPLPDIARLIGLLEIFQYFYFALFQLDTFLLNEMYKPKLDSEYQNSASKTGDKESVPQKHSSKAGDKELEDLRSKINDLEDFRSSTIRYLEQFRFASNVLVESHRSLVKEHEKQWDMDRIEQGIRNKLDLFHGELSSVEQELLAKQQARFTKEQSYLNNLILVITVISLGSVTAQILVLPPLDVPFPPKATDFFSTQLFIVLLSTSIVIFIILFLYSRRFEGYRAKAKRKNVKV